MKKNKKKDNGNIAFINKNIWLPYKKSNLIIRAKYKSSILESKIFAIACSKLDSATENEDGQLSLTFTASMLKKMVDGKRGSIYKQLHEVADNLASTTFAYNDPEAKEFGYYNLIDRVTYKDGVFTIVFGSLAKLQMTNLTKRYSIFKLGIMLKFHSVYAFRLYEILKSGSYKDRNDRALEKNGHEIIMSISELKLELGVIDANRKVIKQALNHCKIPDYDKAVKVAYSYKEKKGADVAKYPSWRDFKRYVVEPAIEEINEITDLNVTYNTIKTGQGGKTTHLIFYVSEKDISKISEEKPEDDEAGDSLTDAVMEIIDEDISVKSAKDILNAAENNMDKVKDAYEKSQGRDIRYIDKWMVKVIRESKKVPKESKDKSKKKTNAFRNFPERDYDNIDELEKKLLAKYNK